MDDETRRTIAQLQAEIDSLKRKVERSARRVERGSGLPAIKRGNIVSTMLTSTPAAVARSKGAAKQTPSKALIEAAAAKQLTLRGLVNAVRALGLNLSSGGLSLALSGDRPIRENVANAIQELTGGRYKASAKNWPGGIRPSADGG